MTCSSKKQPFSCPHALVPASTQSQLHLPGKPTCTAHAEAPMLQPLPVPVCCPPSTPLLLASSCGCGTSAGEAKPSHPLQGLETEGSLRSEAHARGAGGVQVSVCCGRCDPGTRSPGGTEHWPAWPPSAAHSTSPQTRCPRWRSAADRRKACCHHGPQTRSGAPGTGGLPQAACAHREAPGTSWRALGEKGG